MSTQDAFDAALAKRAAEETKEPLVAASNPLSAGAASSDPTVPPRPPVETTSGLGFDERQQGYGYSFDDEEHEERHNASKVDLMNRR